MSAAPPRLSVILAARNEAAWLPATLAALLAQDAAADGIEVIVAANACTDATVALAEAQRGAFAARGWPLRVLDLAEGGKLGALQAADDIAAAPARAYLDADVRLAPEVLGQILAALDTPAPRYATGTLRVARAHSWVTRAYARIWTRLPFVQAGAVGAGFFAVNGPGRARWGEWPRIISDDTFARLQFTAAERLEVPALYHWPMVEGFANLVRVRRRQNAGVDEIAASFPDLPPRAGHAAVTPGALLRLAASDPVGLAVYLAVHLAVRTRRPEAAWTRGR